MAEDVVFTLSFVVYLVLSHRSIVRARKHIRFNWEHTRYRWLRRLISGSAVILAVSVCFNVTAPVLFASTGVDLYQYEWAAFTENVVYSALLYWIAVGGFVQAVPGLQYVAGVDVSANSRKEHYNVNPTLLAEYSAAVEQLMASECPYLDADLTLGTLADQLGVTDKVLSYVLNEGLSVSYVDFVNGLRVEEAKRQLADPATAHLTVLAIGLNSGFSSKATFNRVFKQSTGTTPTEYRRQARPTSS